MFQCVDSEPAAGSETESNMKRLLLLIEAAVVAHNLFKYVVLYSLLALNNHYLFLAFYQQQGHIKTTST